MNTVHEQKPLSHSQRIRTQKAVNGITAMIRRHFEELPQSRLSPSEFKALYGLNNPIHSIRPRFRNLEKKNFIQRLENDKVLSPFGGDEARYVLMVDSQSKLF